MIFKILLLSVILIAIALAAIAIKMFLKKGGEFKKHCSSVDAKTGQRIGCVCGDDTGASCKRKEEETS